MSSTSNVRGATELPASPKRSLPPWALLPGSARSRTTIRPTVTGSFHRSVIQGCPSLPAHSVRRSPSMALVLGKPSCWLETLILAVRARLGCGDAGSGRDNRRDKGGQRNGASEACDVHGDLIDGETAENAPGLQSRGDPILPYCPPHGENRRPTVDRSRRDSRGCSGRCATRRDRRRGGPHASVPTR